MDKTSPKFFCFVLMPFDTSFDDIYNYGIKESCKEVEAYCERVDEQIFRETILDRIYNQISKADLVIADMTGRNSNVFYEVGYAHALDKPTILLTNKSDDIPFDLKHYPHIIYDGKISIIRNELTKRIKWFQENSQSQQSQFKIEIEIYVDDKNLGLEKVVHEYPSSTVPNFDFTIHNASPFSYQPGEFQIGVICEEYQFTRGDLEIETTRMPDGKYLHMLPFLDLMFPGSYKSSEIALSTYSNMSAKENFSVIIRVFTDAGSRDYSLELKKLSPTTAKKA